VKSGVGVTAGCVQGAGLGRGGCGVATGARGWREDGAEVGRVRAGAGGPEREGVCRVRGWVWVGVE